MTEVLGFAVKCNLRKATFSSQEKMKEFQKRLDEARKKRMEERRKERILERKVQRRIEKEEKERKEAEERQRRGIKTIIIN